MRVFVAGSTGAIGRFLVPHLAENGHEVVTLIHSAEKAKEVEAIGAKVTIADALDKDGLITAISRAIAQSFCGWSFAREADR